MLRVILFMLLVFFVSRAVWRLLDGIIEGASGTPPRHRAPEQGVAMVRDPMCGTFVLPGNAVTLVDGRARLYFCSDACRDKYRARPSAGSGRPEPVDGRIA